MKATTKATAKDFKVGTVLIDSEGNEFRIVRHYAESIWEAKGQAGIKCVFESEAKFYTVK